MRHLLIAAALLAGPVTAAHAQVSVSVGLPSVNIGVNVPVYPELVRVPGHPVYYDPRASVNYFFYDGAYWVYEGDSWYASSWYNGPWQLVPPESVPVYVLRVPVRYYRRPPAYFRGWRADAPPRWGEHWGHDWERRRGGWDRWDRRSAPRPAPLPVYQRSYAGDRYPVAPERQHEIRAERYRYQPREEVTRQHFGPPGQAGRGGEGWRDAPRGRGPQRPESGPPPGDHGRRGDGEPRDGGREHEREGHGRGR